MTGTLKKKIFSIPDGMIGLEVNSFGQMWRWVPEGSTARLTGECSPMLRKRWIKAGWMAMGVLLSFKVSRAMPTAIKMRFGCRVSLPDTRRVPGECDLADVAHNKFWDRDANRVRVRVI